MADWKKVEEIPGDASPAEAADAVVETDVADDKKEQKNIDKSERQAARADKKRKKLLAYAEKMQEKEAERNARFSKKGKRRGRFSWAAPVGFIMSVLSVIGAVALVFGAVNLIKDLTDDTALREEAYDFLLPLMTYNPIPDFDDVNAEDLDELLQAAVWRITEAERVRMLREKDDNTAYSLDGNGRLIVPATEIEASYHYLFGNDAVLHHRSLEDDDLEYSEANACYYVPFNFINSLYQPIIDTVRRSGGEYHVRVAYVSVNDLEVDERGKTIPPTADMASFKQVYVLKRADGHFILTAVGQESNANVPTEEQK